MKTRTRWSPLLVLLAAQLEDVRVAPAVAQLEQVRVAPASPSSRTRASPGRSPALSTLGDQDQVARLLVAAARGARLAPGPNR